MKGPIKACSTCMFNSTWKTIKLQKRHDDRTCSGCVYYPKKQERDKLRYD